VKRVQEDTLHCEDESRCTQHVILSAAASGSLGTWLGTWRDLKTLTLA
jgi:hypothetical protein